MLRAAGACMILTGSLGLGIWYKRQFTDRIRSLRLMCNILDLLCSEIRYGLGTLPECCGHMAERLSGACGSAFRLISERMQENRGESFAEVFRECMGEPLGEMPLKDEDREEFFRFVAAGAFADGQMQIKLIEQSREQLEMKADALERENGEKCRMAVGLGAMGGLMIILMLS